MSDTYTIKIEQFEGPFDLLLFFIQKDEIDIYDIPITKITEDFLQYIHTLENLNINIASEFILMSATLIRIKAKMLIPRGYLDQDGNIVDPRKELVDQLIEYKKIKEVISKFEKLEDERSKIYQRGNAVSDLKDLAEKYSVSSEFEPVSIYKLFKAFEKLIEKMGKKDKIVQKVTVNQYKIENEKQDILNKIKINKKLNFKVVFENIENRFHAVVVFLAILELLTTGQIALLQGLGFNNFWLKGKKN